VFSAVFAGIFERERLLSRVRPAQLTQELNMKKLVMVSLSLALLASSSAFAEGKTRAEVYQELIEAQQNGLAFVTDASYPDVSPAFAGTVAWMKAQRLAKQQKAADMASGASSAPGVQ
jgi:phosphoenolpyruvate synthase/pyruvate phosphate dikinase